MTGRVRLQVRELFDRRCGYCGVHEDQIGSELTIDHYRPRTRDGSDQLENLIYCCHACNSLKATYWSEDPEQRILNPRLDDTSAHIHLGDAGQLSAITVRGRIHIDRLQLNRPELVSRRIRESTIAREESERIDLIRRVAELEYELDELKARLGSLED